MSELERREGGPIAEELARRVKLVVFDVDGVLTDAGVYLGVTAQGEPVELKRFDIQDGLGMKLLEEAGIRVVIISGRVSVANRVRARELGMELHEDDAAQKLPVVHGLMEEMGIGWEEVAMLADDVPDLSVFGHVGLKAAVSNATPLVASMADWHTTRGGGHGAAREFCDALLTARGQLDEVVEAYVRERTRP
ncbi:MAG: HAD hydrolase family protein [Gemmatimonadetes bacterium]|nr:HAD hydrolase family protein [Gemmatimonadota bacterium]